MNSDIRISVDFWNHPKTIKLERRLGLEGVKSLTILWMWVARNRPDGNLKGLDGEDIEIAANWNKEPGVLLEALVALRWIDEDEGSYSLHDWLEHNPWAAEADDRSNASRFSRMAQVNKAAFEELQRRGITSLSENEYRHWRKYRPANAGGAPGEAAASSGEASGELLANAGERHGESAEFAGVAPAPGPAPVPAPAPVPVPAPKALKDRGTSADADLSVGKFHKPTVEEVDAHCRARENNIDAEAFVAFYESKGWKVGGQAMKDWKAAVITWEKRNSKTTGPPGKQPEHTPMSYEEAVALSERKKQGNFIDAEFRSLGGDVT